MQNSKETIDTTNDAAELFGDAIYSYTRAQAIEDGILVDVTEVAKEAGFKWPVALTHALWEDCVAWSSDDSRRQTYQDESGRLWDVLFMAFLAIKRASNPDTQLFYQIYRVPRGGRKTKPRLVKLKLQTGPGDHGEPVVTIMQPGED